MPHQTGSCQCALPMSTYGALSSSHDSPQKSFKSERKCHISRFPAARMCRQPSSLRRESFSAPASVSVGSPRCKLRSAKRRRKPHRKKKLIQTHSVVYSQEARYIWWTQIFSKKVQVTKLLLVDWLSKMQKCDF